MGRRTGVLKRVFITLWGLALGTAVQAQTRPAEVEVRWSGTPLVPAFTNVTGDFPLGPVDLEGWYLADGPFLVPTQFVEGGLQVRYGFGDPVSPWLSLGVGVAASAQRTGASMPLVTSASSSLGLFPGMWFLPDLWVFVYGNGFISQLDLKVRGDLPWAGTFVAAGVYGETATEFDHGTGALQYGILAGLGVRW